MIWEAHAYWGKESSTGGRLDVVAGVFLRRRAVVMVFSSSLFGSEGTFLCVHSEGAPCCLRLSCAPRKLGHAFRAAGSPNQEAGLTVVAGSASSASDSGA